MYDALRFADFAFRLGDYLEGISDNLRRGTYYPKPLQVIDIPKSSLSVRPGTVLAIEDHIVLYAMTLLIAPKLDKKLPENVYSWRIKKNLSKKEIFRDNQTIRLPFLKSRTIKRHIEIVEPWYGVWPNFVEKTRYLYEEQGYNYMVISDISAYFENVNLDLLKEQLLHHLPKEPKIINLLIGILEYWTFPSVHGSTVRRGLPQGNDISSFLGNFFLLPLDKKFIAFTNSRNTKYLRYMDDVKVLAKEEPIAKEALFLMNDELRKLHLNIQGAKTLILEGEDIRAELVNDELEKVNGIIKKIQKSSTLSNAKRKYYKTALDKIRKKLPGRRKVIRDQHFRTFRRLITAYTNLGDQGILNLTLKQLRRNPDARLLGSAVRYFRYATNKRSIVVKYLAGVLTSKTPLFPYQEANFLMALRYLWSVPNKALKHARKRLRSKKTHWYVKLQAALLLAHRKLSRRELTSLLKLYEKEKNVEVRRALAICLAQLEKNDLKRNIQGMIFSVHLTEQRVGRFYHGLLFDKKAAMKEINSLFREFHESQIVDRIMEINLLRHNSDFQVRKKLYEKIKDIRRGVRHPIIKEKIEHIFTEIKKEL